VLQLGGEAVDVSVLETVSQWTDECPRVTDAEDSDAVDVANASIATSRVTLLSATNTPHTIAELLQCHLTPYGKENVALRPGPS
jgi:hypothetical protein